MTGAVLAAIVVLQQVREPDAATRAAIADRLGTSRQSVQNLVAKLVDTGAVARTVGGYRATSTSLSIPDVSSDSERHQSKGRYIDTAREDIEPFDAVDAARRIFGDDILPVGRS